MKKSLVILIAATLGLAACKNEKKGAGGLLYTIHKSEGKEKIKEGDYVKVDFIQKNDKDSIIYSTYDEAISKTFPVGKKAYAGDWNDVLLQFGEGDSATFRLNIDTMVNRTKTPKPEQYKDDKYLNFTVKIVKVYAKKDKEADSTFNKRVDALIREEYKTYLEKRKNSENAVIKKYIADHKLNVKTTPSGLNYVITMPGTGPKPVMGDTAMVNYTGKFTFKKSSGNDNVFDTSIDSVAKKSLPPNPMAVYGPRPIPLAENVAKGFVEALQLIGKNGRITAIFPSKLGYGEKGGGPIMPYAPLVFDIELMDIKKGKTLVKSTTPAIVPKK